MTKDKALLIASEALEWANKEINNWIDDAYGLEPEEHPEIMQAITAIKAALEAKDEPVQWGVDWGRAGDVPCVSIIKRLPDGKIEVVAVEYGPQRV
jgi:hypothetical protein